MAKIGFGSGRLTTIELFAGIGGFRIAAERLGLKTLFANDIDDHASAVYSENFGSDVFVQGDLTNLIDVIPACHILTGGFPCQPFSYAGKKQGTNDPRAATLNLIAKILDSGLAKVAVLENVRSLLTLSSGDHFAKVVMILAGESRIVEWRTINTADLGLPQNRRRVILMVRECSIHDHYSAPAYLSPDSHREPPMPLHVRKKPWPSAGVATKTGFCNLIPSDATRIPNPTVLREILESQVADSYDFTTSTLARIDQSTKIHSMINGVEVLWNQDRGARQGYSVYGINGLAPTLTATTSRHYERFKIDGRYRRLTPIEYARLQGFSDHHCDSVAHAKRYILFGNAIPPQLAEWALNRGVEAIQGARSHLQDAA